MKKDDRVDVQLPPGQVKKQARITRIYSPKWVKVEYDDGTAEYVRTEQVEVTLPAEEV